MQALASASALKRPWVSSPKGAGPAKFGRGGWAVRARARLAAHPGCELRQPLHAPALQEAQDVGGVLLEYLRRCAGVRDRLFGSFPRQVHLLALPSDQGDRPRISVHGRACLSGGEFAEEYMLDRLQGAGVKERRCSEAAHAQHALAYAPQNLHQAVRGAASWLGPLACAAAPRLVGLFARLACSLSITAAAGSGCRPRAGTSDPTAVRAAATAAEASVRARFLCKARSSSSSSSSGGVRSSTFPGTPSPCGPGSTASAEAATAQPTCAGEDGLRLRRSPPPPLLLLGRQQRRHLVLQQPCRDADGRAQGGAQHRAAQPRRRASASHCSAGRQRAWRRGVSRAGALQRACQRRWLRSEDALT
jgi:hypothetical protein